MFQTVDAAQLKVLLEGDDRPPANWRRLHEFAWLFARAAGHVVYSALIRTYSYDRSLVR